MLVIADVTRPPGDSAGGSKTKYVHYTSQFRMLRLTLVAKVPQVLQFSFAQGFYEIHEASPGGALRPYWANSRIACYSALNSTAWVCSPACFEGGP